MDDVECVLFVLVDLRNRKSLTPSVCVCVFVFVCDNAETKTRYILVYETEKVWHRLCVCVCGWQRKKRKLDRFKKQRKHVDNEYGMARDSVG